MLRRIQEALQNARNQQQNTSSEDPIEAFKKVSANITAPVPEDLGPQGSPQPEPTKVYGSDYSLEKLIGGQPKYLYFKDPKAGRSYLYDYKDQEFMVGSGPTPERAKELTGDIRRGFDSDELQLIGAIAKPSGGDDTVKVDIDPTKFEFGGRFTPEALRQQAISARSNDKRDNDLTYEYNGITYTDVTGTGQGIPVGATNIRGAHGGIPTPSLDKTYDGYVASGTQLNPDGTVNTGAPQASSSFLESFRPQSMGGVPFDLGAAIGMDAGKLVLSNPPSNRINLENFYSGVKNVGGIENFLRSSQDKLGLLKKYGFKDLIMGKGGDLLPLDEANINNALNEYLSGTTASGDPSTTFGNTFDQISGGGDFINNSGDNQGTTTPSTTTPDTGTGIITSPQGQAFVPMSSGFFPSPERPTVPTGPRTFAPDPRLDPIFPQYGRTNVPPPSVGIPPFVRRPFLPTVRTDYDPAQLYRDSGLPAPGEPGYNPAITPNIFPRQQGIATLPNPMLEEDSPSMTQGIMS